MIHFGLHWNPSRIIYSESGGIPDGFKDERKDTAALVAYARAFMQSEGQLFTESERAQAMFRYRVEEKKRWLKVVEVNSDNIRILNEGMKAIKELKESVEIKDAEPRKDSDQSCVLFLTKDAKQASILANLKITPEYERLKAARDFNRYVASMSALDRSMYLDQMMFLEKFRGRRMRLQRPYFSFGKDENAESFFKSYLNHRYRLFKPTIDDFFRSEVAQKLVSRYQQIMELKEKLKLAA